MWRDAAGQAHGRAGAGARIASLVPSITELLWALGLGPQLVARTGFCVHPAPQVRAVPKVGGTKDVQLERLRALAPTHVVVNVDENRRETVEAIRAFVPHVIVTHPCAPEDNLTLYRLLGGIFAREREAEALCGRLEAALAAVRAQSWPARRVLYAIWQDPWMTVSRDTYISRMLSLVGWQTWPPAELAAAAGEACAGGDCARPNAPGARYPSFRWSEALVRQFDLVLLASEPYRFTEDHADALERQLGMPVLPIDGEMVSWYGSRAIDGIAYLAAFARQA
ncbi:helical backbone metal receptor [Cupriavidus malaysiensis]|uniref:Cobalamin-binding protein n=1 Tax=Cupriavidus malaysiensis TaxID=367825 RepID=A0ABM6F150_9BURK|nr:helical backbone metal receptor [Cupriavidus malaysiensis]AOZ04827.1 cobalamin-binding protein [Cupriavidus malaysiensis]